MNKEIHRNYFTKTKATAMYKTRNTGTGNGKRGTRGEEEMFHSVKRHQTFREVSPNILGNVIKLSGEYRQTFRGMSSNSSSSSLYL